MAQEESSIYANKLIKTRSSLVYNTSAKLSNEKIYINYHLQ